MEEKLGGRERSQQKIEGFLRALEEANLHDLGFLGSKFMRTRIIDPSRRIMERLDRAVAIPDWGIVFPNKTVSHSFVPWSDHVPIIITVENEMNPIK